MHLKRFRGLRHRRLCTASYTDSVLSIASLHTETVNIWSHLLGTAWFCASVARLTFAWPHSLTQDFVVILIYLAAVAYCFACSAMYHIFADHVHASSWLRIDHTGILCAIWASSISFTHFGFKGHETEQQIHMFFVTSATVACLVRLFTISHHDSNGRRARISIHVALGGLAALPGLHFWWINNLDLPSRLLIHFGVLVTMNSIGGGIYATHLLDKAVWIKLGMPDASHHVMHVMAVAGACIYERSLTSEFSLVARANVG